MKTSYVVGFMFSIDVLTVALIRKQKPAFQAGLLNGIGGKIEEGERPVLAMIREFKEETIYPLDPIWNHFAAMDGVNNDGSEFEIQFFASIGQPDDVKSNESEQIEVHTVQSITSRREETLGNVPWLVSLAVDFLTGSHPPKFVVAKY
jgi:8-oxo-dGTP diphosphatase